jgi:hypothetical protein
MRALPSIRCNDGPVKGFSLKKRVTQAFFSKIPLFDVFTKNEYQLKDNKKDTNVKIMFKKKKGKKNGFHLINPSLYKPPSIHCAAEQGYSIEFIKHEAV